MPEHPVVGCRADAGRVVRGPLRGLGAFFHRVEDGLCRLALARGRGGLALGGGRAARDRRRLVGEVARARFRLDQPRLELDGRRARGADLLGGRVVL